jgi:hypothetical protein
MKEEMYSGKKKFVRKKNICIQNYSMYVPVLGAETCRWPVKVINRSRLAEMRSFKKYSKIDSKGLSVKEAVSQILTINVWEDKLTCKDQVGIQKFLG